MISDRLLDRLADHFARLPMWLRPSAMGVAFLLVFAAWRGALVIGPLLLIGILIWVPSPFAFIGAVLAAYLVVLAGAAVCGLVYHFIGQHLQRVPYVGRFLAAVVTILPYPYSFLPFIRMREERFSFSPPTEDEHVIALSLTIVFAAVVIFVLRRDNVPESEDGDAA